MNKHRREKQVSTTQLLHVLVRLKIKTFGAKCNSVNKKLIEKLKSLSSFDRASTMGQKIQDWGREFILLLPNAAVLPRSDAGNDGPDAGCFLVAWAVGTSFLVATHKRTKPKLPKRKVSTHRDVRQGSTNRKASFSGRSNA